jgi:hypothetical protein
MMNLFMKVWKDPVWSKVIAAGAITILSAIAGITSRYRAPAHANVPSTTTSTSDSVSSGYGTPDLVFKSAPSPRTDRLSAVETSPIDPQSASVSLEYDSLNERFSAVNQSLTQRASDLGNLPLKPEVAAALGTARADLAAIKRALHERNWNVATKRMGRVKKTLSYLESL